MTTDVSEDPKQVFKRKTKILAIYQIKTDCFKVSLILFGTTFDMRSNEIAEEVEIELTANQLFQFRSFQKAILRKFGFLVYDQSIEADGVSRWPSQIASAIKDGAQ